MSKVRIYELAKKLNRNNKEVLDELHKYGIEGKTHSSSIDADVAEKITQTLSGHKADVQPAAVPSSAPAGTSSGADVQKKHLPSRKTSANAGTATAALAVKKAEPAGKAHEVTTLRPANLKPDPEVIKQGTVVAEEDLTAAGVEEKAVDGLTVAVAEIETEEEIVLPDKLKKEVEADKIEKFKERPGLHKAFTNVRKIEQRKGHDNRGGKKGGARFTGRSDQKQLQSTAPRKKMLKLREGTTVKEFSELIGLKISDVIKKFMELGYMPTINQPVDADAALLVAQGFGVKLELASVEEDVRVEEVRDDSANLTHRAPVVTIMGHVDHGKTSLLDAVRETKVTETEAGGITQHIGAYKINLKNKDIVFLDTPGHEAFTAMRARGAKVTDIVVLVVAADDGVMPQTVEAINHAKAAGVPIVVAVNKIDKPDANPQKVKNELAEHGIISEEWGGHNIFVEVSAKKRIGIEHLLEMILLQAEIMELKANHDREARGTVIEAKLDRGRGPVATLLVQNGALKVGDALLCGIHVGKVRALIDDMGKRIQVAGPSTPVEVIGFSEVPAAGEVFTVVEDEKRARQIALTRSQKQRTAELAHAKKLTLDELYTKIQEGQIRELNIIIKGDVQGSVEAIKDAFENIGHAEVKVRVIHTSVGGINESDVMLATASNAIIIGFNVRPETKASQMAEKEGVDIRLYNVIYEAIEDVKKALEGMLAPTLKEKVLGRAEVRQLFPVSRLGTIAGCSVIDGYMSRACDGIRVLRDNVVVYEGKLHTLRRFKDDVKEVQTGYECGILVENFNDIKIGDILENYIIEKIASKLQD